MEINGHSLGASSDSLILPFDPHIMEVILQNILTNAMKNGDHIQIRVKDRNEKVRVEVQDNGPGLDLAKLQRQLMVAASRSPDAESTNLGLKVTLHLRVDNNNKFVRGKKLSREDIEQFVLSQYGMRKRHWSSGGAICQRPAKGADENGSALKTVL